MQPFNIPFLTFFCLCCVHHVPQVLTVTILDTPYLASIEVNGEYVCSGAVIDDLYILTSQTCTNQLSLDTMNVTVRVGTSKLSYRGQVVAATDIQPDDQLGTDLSLVKVATSFVYDPHTMWVNMNNVGMTEGSVGVVSVWSSKTRKSDVQLSSVQVINNNTCASLLNDTYVVDATQACVLPTISYALSCKADIGAPFFHDEMLFGVVSYNPGCDDSTLPLVITFLADTGSYVLSKMCGIENILV